MVEILFVLQQREKEGGAQSKNNTIMQYCRLNDISMETETAGLNVSSNKMTKYLLNQNLFFFSYLVSSHRTKM